MQITDLFTGDEHSRTIVFAIHPFPMIEAAVKDSVVRANRQIRLQNLIDDMTKYCDQHISGRTTQHAMKTVIDFARNFSSIMLEIHDDAVEQLMMRLGKAHSEHARLLFLFGIFFGTCFSFFSVSIARLI